MDAATSVQIPLTESSLKILTIDGQFFEDRADTIQRRPTNEQFILPNLSRQILDSYRVSFSSDDCAQQTHLDGHHFTHVHKWLRVEDQRSLQSSRLLVNLPSVSAERDTHLDPQYSSVLLLVAEQDGPLNQILNLSRLQRHFGWYAILGRAPLYPSSDIDKNRLPEAELESNSIMLTAEFAEECLRLSKCEDSLSWETEVLQSSCLRIAGWIPKIPRGLAT